MSAGKAAHTELTDLHTLTSPQQGTKAACGPEHQYKELVNKQADCSVETEIQSYITGTM